MNNDIRTHCYNKKCGPVVEAGFHFERWLVCKECKQEVTQRLAEEIEERIAIKEENIKKPIDDEGFPW